MQPPIGYVRRPSGEVVKDPDEQVRTVVTTILDQFEARGTIAGVLCYLVNHDVRLPVRIRGGACKGDIEWHRPNRVTLQNMLHNPTYAGAYVYGREAAGPTIRVYYVGAMASPVFHPTARISTINYSTLAACAHGGPA